MVFQNEPIDSYSVELEDLAIKRFRELTEIVPKKCLVFRRMENKQIVVLSLDFSLCPQELVSTIEKYGKLTVISHKLGLADILEFRINRHLVGWTNITKNN